MEKEKEKNGKILRFPSSKKSNNNKPLDAFRIYKMLLIANMAIMAISLLIIVLMQNKTK